MAIYYPNSNSADGRLIQAVGSRISTGLTSSTTSFVNTPLTKSITTKEAGSQLILVSTLAVDCAADGIYARVKFCWTRSISGGNSNTFDCSGGQSFGAYLGAHGSSHMRHYGTWPQVIFDPQSLTGNIPANTSVTYTLSAKNESHNNRDFRINYGGRDSFIAILEVAS